MKDINFYIYKDFVFKKLFSRGKRFNYFKLYQVLSPEEMKFLARLIDEGFVELKIEGGEKIWIIKK